MAYLYDTSDKPEGYGGGGGGNFDSPFRAARHGHPHRRDQVEARARRAGFGSGGMSGGILTTAGDLLFTGDSGQLVAFDPANGKTLWNQRLTQPVSNGPSTWMLDGKQYLIVGAGDTLYALTLARTAAR